MTPEPPVQDDDEFFATSVAPYLYLPQIIQLRLDGRLTAGQPAGTVVGRLEAQFPTTGVPVAFAIVPGPDSSLFWLDGEILYTSVPFVNTEPLTVNLLIQAVDSLNGDLEQVIPVTVWPSESPPSDVGVSSDGVAADSPLGTIVGSLWTTDPNIGVTHTYELLQGGDIFAVDDNQFITRAAIPNVPTLEIILRSTNTLGQTCERSLTLVVWPVQIAEPSDEAPPEAPADLTSQSLVAGPESFDREMVESIVGTVLLGLHPRVLTRVVNQKTARIATLGTPPALSAEQVAPTAAPGHVEQVVPAPEAEYVIEEATPTSVGAENVVPPVEGSTLERVQVFQVVGIDPTSHEVVRLGELVTGTEASSHVEPANVESADTETNVLTGGTSSRLAIPPGILKTNTIIRVRGSNRVRTDVRTTESNDPSLPGTFAQTITSLPSEPLELSPVAEAPPEFVEAPAEFEEMPEEVAEAPAEEEFVAEAPVEEEAVAEAPSETEFVAEEPAETEFVAEEPPVFEPAEEPVALEPEIEPAPEAEIIPEDEVVVADLDEDDDVIVAELDEDALAAPRVSEPFVEEATNYQPAIYSVDVSDAAGDWAAYLPPGMRLPAPPPRRMPASPTDEMFSDFDKVEPAEAIDPNLWAQTPTIEQTAQVRQQIDHDLFVNEEPGTGSWGLTALGGFSALHGRKVPPNDKPESKEPPV